MGAGPGNHSREKEDSNSEDRSWKQRKYFSQKGKDQIAMNRYKARHERFQGTDLTMLACGQSVKTL